MLGIYGEMIIDSKCLNYFSDGIIRCKTVKRKGNNNDNDKIDIQVISANKQMESITGVPCELIVNNLMTDVFPKLKESVFDWPKIISEAAMTNENKIIEQYIVAFEKYLRINIFGYDNGYFIVALTDITEKKEIKRQLLERDRQIQYLENELKQRANIENLTGMDNYQFIIESITDSAESFEDEDISFTVLLLDVDNFHEINLNYGIKTGDKVLKDIALCISSLIRKIDVAGRYGPDEFIVIFNNMDMDIAKIMVEKLKLNMSKYIAIPQNEKVSVSGVLVEYNGENIAEFLYEVENKLKIAKEKGSGTIL